MQALVALHDEFRLTQKVDAGAVEALTAQLSAQASQKDSAAGAAEAKT